ncbi:MAG: DNA polymerase III subunit delta [Candidatus Falkowbacteria bacterium]
MIIFFYGENSFRAKQRINELKAKFFREIDPSGQSFNMIDGASADLAGISAIINTGSLFVKKRLTLIENLFGNKKDILPGFLDFIQKNKLAEGEDILIIYESKIKSGKKNQIVKIGAERENALTIKEKKLFTYLSAQKYGQEFKSFSDSETIAWIKKEVDDRGGLISPANAALIFNLAGNDLWQLNNDISKLVNYKKSGTTKIEISSADIKELVNANLVENIFSLTDALSAKNKSQVLKIFEEQLSLDVSPEYILAMVLRHFKTLLQLKDCLEEKLSPSQISVKVKMNPYIFTKSLSQANGFTLSTLKKISNDLIELDFLNKSGQMDLKTGLSLFFAKI